MVYVLFLCVQFLALLAASFKRQLCKVQIIVCVHISVASDVTKKSFSVFVWVALLDLQLGQEITLSIVLSLPFPLQCYSFVTEQRKTKMCTSTNRWDEDTHV